jgi:hypothetical protein
MEERIDQFWEAAQAFIPISSHRTKWRSEVSKLRKFLHRNQSVRLPELPQQRLLDTVRLYTTLFPTEDDVLLLVKDALSMPFGVFGTKHKKRLLKIHEQLVGKSEGGNSDHETEPLKETWYCCLGIDADGYLSLLDECSGDICESIKLDKKTPEWRKIKQHVDEGTVRVKVTDEKIVDVKVEES